jgi:NAD+ synthase (glutamine-hydrolysing)
MKIGLAQINPIVGDIPGNAQRIVRYARDAAALGAELVVFPELSVTGYPPLDLLENASFIAAAEEAVDRIASDLPEDVGIVIGAPVRNPRAVGKRLLNVAIVLEQNRRHATIQKSLLPTYDVFDESRYFEAATSTPVVEWRGIRVGLHVCEDMWNIADGGEMHRPYPRDPVADLAEQGVDIFVNISASPFALGRRAYREFLATEIARRHGRPFLLVNQVGANTELLFDGSSIAVSASGAVVQRADPFSEALLIWDSTDSGASEEPGRSDLDDLHDGIVMGIRDYVEKTGAFSRALVGLSGGIDSAVTCALAVEALGAERVVGVTMPSRYSSEGSVSDSEALASALGIEFHHIAIGPAVKAFGMMLHDLFEGTPPGIAEENVQARSRGVTLMAISNKFGYLLLTTGNKSELSVGYATLYGDMSGGLAVLADVYKTQVYALAGHINTVAGRDIIPQSTILKPPSAELRPDQKDTDSLPEYEVLDRILRLYVEEHLDLADIVATTGFEAPLVRQILDLVDRNEYKRRQAPPGLRVSLKAFGMGRRVPIVMRWNRSS